MNSLPRLVGETPTVITPDPSQSSDFQYRSLLVLNSSGNEKQIESMSLAEPRFENMECKKVVTQTVNTKNFSASGGSISLSSGNLQLSGYLTANTNGINLNTGSGDFLVNSSYLSLVGNDASINHIDISSTHGLRYNFNRNNDPVYIIEEASDLDGWWTNITRKEADDELILLSDIPTSMFSDYQCGGIYISSNPTIEYSWESSYIYILINEYDYTYRGSYTTHFGIYIRVPGHQSSDLSGFTLGGSSQKHYIGINDRAQIAISQNEMQDHCLDPDDGQTWDEEGENFLSFVRSKLNIFFFKEFWHISPRAIKSMIDGQYRQYAIPKMTGTENTIL